MRYFKILLLIVGLLQSNYGLAYDFRASGYFFDIISGKKEVILHSVNGKQALMYSGDVTIPVVVKDYCYNICNVVGICGYAFAASSITSIKIPNMIK